MSSRLQATVRALSQEDKNVKIREKVESELEQMEWRGIRRGEWGEIRSGAKGCED